MKTPPPDTSRRTLAHYERNADSFWAGTKEHDVSQNIDALILAIGRPAPLTILDLGCGPGRDLLAFKRLGHDVVGLDGCARFVEMARAQSGVTVWHQDFLDLALPRAAFDGVFANASLFHVPGAHLAKVASQVFETLKPGGVLVASNPRGDESEGYNGERYGCYLDREGWGRVFEEAGFEEVRHYFRPDGKPRNEQPWIVFVVRRPAA